jgi:hypothetical protein
MPGPPHPVDELALGVQEPDEALWRKRSGVLKVLLQANTKIAGWSSYKGCVKGM